jgi:hypothetical protein
MTTATYRAAVDFVKDEAPCKCGDCEWHGYTAATTDIEDCILTPGDESPVGRCPECGTLAYLVKPNALASVVREAENDESGAGFWLVVRTTSGKILRGPILGTADQIEREAGVRMDVHGEERTVFIAAEYAETVEIEW